jgi:uncharacterized protein (UPF0254 family)
MGLFENGMKTTLSGLAIGVGVAVVAPILIPILASIAKPLTKTVIKEGLILYDKGKEKMAEAKETVGDLLAEAKSEIADADLAAETGSGEVASSSYLTAAGQDTKKAKKRPSRRKNP